MLIIERDGKYKMKEKHDFLYWLIAVCTVALGVAIAQNFHLWEIMNSKDATKISWLICGITIATSITIGIITYRRKKTINIMNRLWFIADAMVTLGMIGTVLGFLMMMGDGFNAINVTDQASMQKTMQAVGTGMGTILVTTVMGLIASLVLKLQLVIVDHEE
jgi:hypothetical protein